MKEKIFKILSVSLFLIIPILFVEAFFGYWFKENNFGYLMRSERQKKVYVETEHDKIKYKFYYKRNFYGFRGDEFDPKNVKIIFEGGSTANQRFTPESLTIVGQLNKKFSNENINVKIYNASTDGKTLKGIIYDFYQLF